MRRLTNPYYAQLKVIKRLQREGRLFGVERWFSIALASSLMLLPAMLVRWLGGLFGYYGRKITLEMFAIAKPTFLFALLFFGFGGNRWAGLFAIVSLVDLYVYLLGLVFLRRHYDKAASYQRSVLLLAVNFLESLLAFAVLYLSTSSIARGGAGVHDWGDAVYFSVITAGTVGYGDITPCPNPGRLLVVLQILASLFFVVVILATFVPGLFDNRGSNRRDAA
jgi:hypothetical protein